MDGGGGGVPPGLAVHPSYCPESHHSVLLFWVTKLLGVPCRLYLSRANSWLCTAPSGALARRHSGQKRRFLRSAADGNLCFWV